jgi:comEA protein
VAVDVALPDIPASASLGPRTPEAPIAPGANPGSAPPPAAPARKLNLNTATAAELELLPGIGPALAGRIVEHRTRVGRFKSVAELDDVSGIGPRTLERLAPLVYVD